MKVEILAEFGYEFALEGLRYSYEADIDRMPYRAYQLAICDDGHNKYLEQIMLWIRIVAPRYWWQQIDTYRAPEDGENGFQPSGITKQSGSTMHTLMKRPLVQDDFQRPISIFHLVYLNDLIANRQFEQLKNDLPEGFLQPRLVSTNYKVLRGILRQRSHHKLDEWNLFCDEIAMQCEHPEYLRDVSEIALSRTVPIK